MYTNILIPTDGSEPAGKAVRHGIAAIVLGNRTVKVLTLCKIPVLVHR